MDKKSKWIKDVLDGNHLNTVDVSNTISDKTMDKIITEQSMLNEQLSIFDNDLSESTLDTEPSSKKEASAINFFNLQLLSPINGYTQTTLTITDENRVWVNKWLDEKTNSVYCIEVYRNGSSQYYYTKKEIFDSIKHTFDLM